jgi:hypothetical protein
MDDYIFIILRHVTKDLKNSDEIWKICYKSIRQFYNNKIIIIDNNSDYSIIKNDIELDNCETINCEFYNSRLFSPFYELLNIDFDRAIIIHDGVIFQHFVDFSSFKNVKFIWHFDTKQYDNIGLIENQLNLLLNNNILFDIFKKKKYTGCMGCCLAITKKFLTNLEDSFKISNLKTNIKNQQDAMAFERTISILCFALYPDIINDLSFEGEIKYMVWGYNYNHYINKQKTFESIEWDTQKKVTIDITNKSIIKIFGART